MLHNTSSCVSPTMSNNTSSCVSPTMSHQDTAKTFLRENELIKQNIELMQLNEQLVKDALHLDELIRNLKSELTAGQIVRAIHTTYTKCRQYDSYKLRYEEAEKRASSYSKELDAKNEQHIREKHKLEDRIFFLVTEVDQLRKHFIITDKFTPQEKNYIFQLENKVASTMNNYNDIFKENQKLRENIEKLKDELFQHKKN